MSIDATLATWKLQKPTVTSTEKILLLSCADRASEQGICWPSLQRLEKDTCLNRKTLIKVRQSVIDKGLLRFTGEYHGKQNQIPEMQLLYICNRSEDDCEFQEQSEQTDTSTNFGTGESFTSTNFGTGTGPNFGTQNLKEEPHNTHTLGMCEKIYSLNEFQSGAMKDQCLSDQRCINVYHKLSHEEQGDMSMADYLDEAIVYYNTRQTMMCPNRYLGWLRNVYKMERRDKQKENLGIGDIERRKREELEW